MILEAEKIQQIDVPNKNNRVYPLSVIEQIVIDHNNKPVSGTIGMPKVMREQGYPLDLKIPLADISHFATNLRIKDGWLVADIAIQDISPKGKELHDLLGRSTHVDFRMAGYANFTDIGESIQTVNNFALCSINAVADGA